MITKVFLGSFLALGLSLSVSAKETTQPAPQKLEDQLQMSLPEVVPLSCKASGQACTSKDECCSGMCKKKCG